MKEGRKGRMSEKQNNFVKIWAVVAPLAALAGLYYVHSRRRRTGKTLTHDS